MKCLKKTQFQIRLQKYFGPMVCVATADISTFVIINARHFNQRTNARQEAVSHCAYGGTQVGGTPALTQSCVSVMHVPNALMFEFIKTVWLHSLNAEIKN